MEPTLYQSENVQPQNSFLTKRNIIALLLLGILVLAVPFAVSLLQKRQELRSKADVLDPITFRGEGVACEGNECTTTGDKIEIELRDPKDYQSGSGSSGGN